jgi:hypothetical protein
MATIEELDQSWRASEVALLGAQKNVRSLDAAYYDLTAKVNALNKQILAKTEAAYVAMIEAKEANAKVHHKDLHGLKSERAVAKGCLDYLKCIGLPDAHSAATQAEITEMDNRASLWSQTAKEERERLLEGLAATGDAGAGAEVDLSKTHSQKLADEAHYLFLSAGDLKVRLAEDVLKRDVVKQAYRERQVE